MSTPDRIERIHKASSSLRLLNAAGDPCSGQLYTWRRELLSVDSALDVRVMMQAMAA